MTEVDVAKKVKKTKKVVEEVEVEVKKVKKSKKSAEVESEAAADEEPAKKKKKKNKEAESEVASEAAVTEEEPKKEKKDKKKKKKAEEEKAEETDAPAESKSDSEDEEPVAKKAKVEEEVKVEETKAEETPESTTVFVGGLSFNSTEEVVKKDFAECGEIVNFRFPMDREYGTPKGIAFVTYKDQAGVKKALEFNETEYDGRTLRVRVAEDSPPGKGDGKKGKGKKGNVVDEKPAGCKGVILKSMSWDTTEESLWALFKDMEDSINKLNLVKDKETGASRGMAFIDFHTEEAVDEAMKKQGTELDGRSIFMNYNGPKEDKGKGKFGKKGDGKKGDGKKGKGKKGKGKGKEPDAARTRNMGGIVASEGKTATFDSDSD